MKYAAPFAEPFTFLTIRFALVVVILLPLILAIGRLKLGFNDFLAGAMVGALLHGVYLASIFLAIKQGLPAGVAAIVISLQPLLSASVVAPMLGERVEARHWAGLVLGLAGALIVLWPAVDMENADFGAGTLAISLIGLGAITIGTTLQKAWFAHLDFRTTLLPQYVGATLFVAIMAVLFETGEVQWSWPAIGAMAWLVLVLSIGAISLFMMLLRQNEVWRTVTLFYLIPPLTTLTAWLLFDEALGVLQLFGMLVVVVAMILARPPRPA